MLPPDPKKALPNKASDTTPDRVGLAPEPAHAEPTAPPAAVTAPPGLGTLLHAFRNPGAERCQILWVNTTKRSEVRDGA